MAKSKNTHTANKPAYTKKALKEKIESKLISRGVTVPNEASDEQLFEAVALTVKDIMLENRAQFKKRARASGAKKICYLCMEFLVGRSLKNDAVNLGIYEDISNILLDYGTTFEKV